MKAIFYNGKGDCSVIELREMEDPKPGPSEVLIAVSTSGLNRADIVQRKGAYPPPPGESEIPGLELCGHVVELGANAKRFRVGQRVMALTASGAHASLCKAHEDLCLPVPDSMSDTEAGAFPEAFLTAHHNVFHLGALQAKETALIHAGASGVGTAAILMASQRGKVFVTVGSPEKARLSERLGATAIEYKKGPFEKTFLEMAPKGANVILDCIGADYLEGNLAALATEGRWVVIGLMGGREGKIDLAKCFQKRARLIFSSLRALPIPQKAQIIRRFLADWGTEVESGRLKPVLDQSFPASRAAEAQTRMERNLNQGKITLSWK